MTKNDFKPEDVVRKDEHARDMDNVNQSINTLFSFLNDKFSTNEKIADTLYETSQKAVRMQDMFRDVFVKLMREDAGVKEAVKKLIAEEDRNFFIMTLKRFGIWLIGALVFIGGIVAKTVIDIISAKVSSGQ